MTKLDVGIVHVQAIENLLQKDTETKYEVKRWATSNEYIFSHIGEDTKNKINQYIENQIIL